jgi:hypothetical protein
VKRGEKQEEETTEQMRNKKGKGKVRPRTGNEGTEME